MSITATVDEEIAALGPWFHNLHLPDGRQTAPDHRFGDFPAIKWRHVRRSLPSDLAGWKVLDIGCNAGFYSFELGKRGAQVLGIDHDPRYLRQAQWALRQHDLEGRVSFARQSVFALLNYSVGSFDLVLFLGVFYHMRYPLLALDLISRLRPRLLAFQSMIVPDADAAAGDAEPPYDLRYDDRDRLNEPGWPRVAFIENRLLDDPTNWWVPNRPAVRGLLRAAGFRIVEAVGEDIFICAPLDNDPLAEARHAAMREVWPSLGTENACNRRL